MAKAEVSHANCGHCGAPLAVSGGPILVCQYCGREHRVSVPQPAPQAYAYPPLAKSDKSEAWYPLLRVGAFVLAGLVFAAWRLFGSAASSPERTGAGQQTLSGVDPQGRAVAAAPPLEGAPDSWLSDTPMFVKGVGELPNPVGVAGFPNIGYQLTALLGESGKALWHAPADSSAQAYTDGTSAVLLTDSGNKLASYDAQSGKQLWVITLAQAIYDVTFGANCASLYLSSGKTLGIALESGQAGPCSPVKPAIARSLRDELKDYRAVSGDFTVVGSLRADPKPINPEPTRLAVQVSRAGQVLWQATPTSLEPVWTFRGFPRSMVLTPAGVFVFGRHAGDGLARWVLLDLPSGGSRYERAGTTKVDSEIYLASAGAMVFVSHDRRLEAYRAQTGALVWFAGSSR